MSIRAVYMRGACAGLQARYYKILQPRCGRTCHCAVHPSSSARAGCSRALQVSAPCVGGCGVCVHRARRCVLFTDFFKP